MYERENCWPHEECPQQHFVDRILGNPIYNFQVLKRLLVYFKNVEKELKEMDMKSKSFLFTVHRARFWLQGASPWLSIFLD